MQEQEGDLEWKGSMACIRPVNQSWGCMGESLWEPAAHKALSREAEDYHTHFIGRENKAQIGDVICWGHAASKGWLWTLSSHSKSHWALCL